MGLMSDRTSFITLHTRQYTAEVAEVENGRARLRRAEDLNEYGRAGYVLQSTIVVPQSEGVLIVDTLSRRDQTDY